MRKAVIHESILYDALGETTDEKQKAAKNFLNDIANISYKGNSFSYFPGQVFERLQGLTEKCPQLIAFCEIFIIKYPDTDERAKGHISTYHPYIRLACELCIRDNLCIVSTSEKFEKKKKEDNYLFFVGDPITCSQFLGLSELLTSS